MDANKFWETKRQICNTYDSCSDGCPLYSRDSGQSCLGTTTNIKKEVDIMEQWLKENGEPVEQPKPKLDAESLAEFKVALKPKDGIAELIERLNQMFDSELDRLFTGEGELKLCREDQEVILIPKPKNRGERSKE